MGGVSVPDKDGGVDTPLDIGGTGALTHAKSGVTADTYTKVTVDDWGHITAGANLGASDIPNLDASKITTGQLATSVSPGELAYTAEVYTKSIADQSISRRHFNDISIAYVQEAQPTSTQGSGTDSTVFRGCLWFKESTGQLFMYNGNAWHIVAGGQLTQENLRFCGTYNADTNKVVTLTDEGTAEQLSDGTTAFQVGSPIPSGDDDISGAYFLIEVGGSNINVNNVNGETFTPGDLLLCIGQASGWLQVSGSFGTGAAALWTRGGISPNVLIQPANTADNLNLKGSNYMFLPRDATANPPVGGSPADQEGAVRWNQIDDVIEVFNGTAWEANAKKSNLQWETKDSGDNSDWGQDLLRPGSDDSDIGVKNGRDLVFERGTPTSAGDSGDMTSRMTTEALTAVRTWTLPNTTGVFVTDMSVINGAGQNLEIDAGTY